MPHGNFKFTDEIIAKALNELPLGPHRIRLASKAVGCSHHTVLNWVHKHGIHAVYTLPEPAPEPVTSDIEIAITMPDDVEMFGEPYVLTPNERELIRLTEEHFKDDVA